MSMVNTAPGKISVRNLNFYYGKFHALKNINLDITKNQVTAFIGPSGCGKSTLLRTFNKMFELYPEQRAEGEILLDGDNILTNTQDIALLRAKVGMVFQKPTPFPMSIYDNIAFGVRLFEKLSRADMDERVQWALTKAALWNETKDKLHQSGYSLSGGQQQRLCIARGIAIRPEVLHLRHHNGVDEQTHHDRRRGKQNVVDKADDFRQHRLAAILRQINSGEDTQRRTKYGCPQDQQAAAGEGVSQSTARRIRRRRHFGEQRQTHAVETAGYRRHQDPDKPEQTKRHGRHRQRQSDTVLHAAFGLHLATGFRQFGGSLQFNGRH